MLVNILSTEIKERAIILTVKTVGFLARMDNWYEFTCIKDFAHKYGNLRLAHANWAENFSFTHFRNTNRATISRNTSVPNFLQSIKQIRNEFAEGHGPGDLEIEYSQMEILKENLINEFSEILACT